MKKRTIIGAAILVMLLPVLMQGCEKDNSQELRDRETRLLNKYLEEHNITQKPTDSGLYYIEIEKGVGTKAGDEFFVDFEYTAKLVDGTVIGTSYEEVAKDHDIYREGSLYGPVRVLVGYTGVPGLDEGFQFMHEGGRAEMILPSDINGMGGTSTSLSPAYSTHIYTVKLVNAFNDPEIFQDNQITWYLEDHNIDSSYVTTTGLHYIEKTAGSGDLIANGDNLEVRYTGRFLDGRVFDSNLDGNTLLVSMPAVPNYISGWDTALRLMKEGTSATIIVPYEEAYGAEGRGPIPPYATLVFDMEVVKVL